MIKKIRNHVCSLHDHQANDVDVIVEKICFLTRGLFCTWCIALQANGTQTRTSTGHSLASSISLLGQPGNMTRHPIIIVNSSVQTNARPSYFIISRYLQIFPRTWWADQPVVQISGCQNHFSCLTITPTETLIRKLTPFLKLGKLVRLSRTSFSIRCRVAH